VTATGAIRSRSLGAWSRLSLATRIVIGLAIGILVGLFLGETAAVLQPVADIYIRLMQMTVLPYLVLTLIIGLGRMEADEARRLALRGCVLLVVFWALTLAIIGLMPLAFPSQESASFFSTSLLQQREPLALHEIYVPSNPFHALANAVIPGVVLFSSALGVALIGLKQKGALIVNLQILEQAVVRVTRFVVSLTPFGVFAIVAVAAGTLDLETLARLEVYLVCFGVASMLLTFVVLPLVVTACTPFTYREVMSVAKEALITAFVTNSAFIVLPLIIVRANELMERHRIGTAETESTVEVLVPLGFTFPNAGKLLTMLFVPYGAWLMGTPLDPAGYGALFGAGLFAYFAKAQVALPYLLDLVGVPQDHFQLYIPTTIITGKFDSMVSAMSLLAFALLGAGAMGGFLKWTPARLAVSAAAVCVAIVVAILGARAVLGVIVDTTYRKAEVLKRMHASRSTSAAIVYRDLAVVPPAPATGGSALDRVRTRGTLRVGYDPGNAPFSFVNADGELVGLDVELAMGLAEDLGVQAVFVPVPWSGVSAALAEGKIDLMPSMWVRPFWFSSVRLSEPYLTGTMALITRDERRHDFASVEALHRSRGLKIGVPLDASQVKASLQRYFGDADVQFVPMDSPLAFFEGRRPELDAYLMPAESGAAATLLFPQYTVVVPEPNPMTLPIAFGMPLHSDDLAGVVNTWIVFARSEGSIQRAYEYWVLGKGAEPRRRRWSFMRDVLGWGQ
jgi:Na+/H+-dicarboxylate symporter/ABC-type amino acid transport substrate-binding protein